MSVTHVITGYTNHPGHINRSYHPPINSRNNITIHYSQTCNPSIDILLFSVAYSSKAWRSPVMGHCRVFRTDVRQRHSTPVRTSSLPRMRPRRIQEKKHHIDAELGRVRCPGAWGYNVADIVRELAASTPCATGPQKAHVIYARVASTGMTWNGRPTTSDAPTATMSSFTGVTSDLNWRRSGRRAAYWFTVVSTPRPTSLPTACSPSLRVCRAQKRRALDAKATRVNRERNRGRGRYAAALDGHSTMDVSRSRPLLRLAHPLQPPCCVFQHRLARAPRATVCRRHAVRRPHEALCDLLNTFKSNFAAKRQRFTTRLRSK